MPGFVLVNGNVERETDFIHEQRERITSVAHADPTVRASRKMLLVTAAWGEREYEEAHVKQALAEVGIPPSLDQAGFDVGRQNLGLFHMTQELFARAPELAAQWSAKERVAQGARAYYLDTTRSAVARFRQALAHARRLDPKLRVAALLDPHARSVPSASDERSLLGRFLREQLAADLEQLRAADERMLRTMAELDADFERATGARFHPVWRELRSRLEERLLGSAGIFLFGGDPVVLSRGLRLFQLAEVFAEALRRGAGVFSVSAGSLVLGDRVIVYHQREGAEFELLERGMGLLRGIQLFPHCMERVQTDDADNLAYLAFRFHHGACAGLNEGSYLLLDFDARGEIAARSVGTRDGVYVFHRDGAKRRYDAGSEITLAEG
jgi:hypothetical protein